MVFVTVVLVSAACSGGGGDGDAAAGGDRRNRTEERSGTGADDIDASDVEVPALPAPLEVGGEADAQAAELAGKVRAGGDDARAALVTALPRAGFPVVDGDALLSPGYTGYGVAVAPWETWTMAESAGSGGMFLTDIADALLASMGKDDADEATTAALAARLRDDLRAAADGPEGTGRFFARFVLASTEPASLDGEPATLALDALAAQLVLRALAGSVAAWSAPALASNGDEQASSTGGRSDGTVDLGPLTLISATSVAPCTPGDSTWSGVIRVEEEVISRGVRAFNAGVLRVPWFEGLLPYLDGIGLKGARAVAEGLGQAQVLLDYARLVLSLILLRVEGEWDGAGPLIRTKEARPRTGERRTFTTRVSYDISNVPLINCYRLFFASAGIRFRLPAGPAAGAGVTFVPRQGFDARSDRIVQFVGGELDVPADQDGKAKIGVEGFGQEKKKPADAPPVEKRLAFDVIVHQRPGVIEDLWAAITSSRDLGFMKVPLELFNRTRWLAPTRFEHPVTDWGDDEPLFDVTITGKQTTTSSSESTLCGAMKAAGSQSLTFSTNTVRLQRLTAEAGSGETRVLMGEPGSNAASLGIGSGGGVELSRFTATIDVDRHVDVDVVSVDPACVVDTGEPDGFDSRPDCGRRRVSRLVSLEYADRLLTIRDGIDSIEAAYLHCTHSEPEYLLDPTWADVKLDPGSRFDEAALSNPDLDKIIVIGGGYENFVNTSPGVSLRRNTNLEWTMVLCRVKADGTSAC